METVQDPAFAQMIRALANARRIQILQWLKDPRAHFREQVDGDLVEDGVCAILIADKLKVSAPSLSDHMKVLQQAGLVKAKRVKQWTFYRRNEDNICALSNVILRNL